MFKLGFLCNSLNLVVSSPCQYAILPLFKLQTMRSGRSTPYSPCQTHKSLYHAPNCSTSCARAILPFNRWSTQFFSQRYDLQYFYNHVHPDYLEYTSTPSFILLVASTAGTKGMVNAAVRYTAATAVLARHLGGM